MTESMSDNLALTGPRTVGVEDRRAAATIDLRFPEAQWTHRQLQARVSHARDLLARAEADAATRAPVVADVDPEVDLGASLVASPDLIAREWSDTARTAEAHLAAAEVEVRRILDAALAEVRALEKEAEFLRSHPVAGGTDAAPC